MKKSFYYLIVSFVLLLSSCQPNAKTYNDAITGAYTSVVEVQLKCDAAVSSAIESKNYDAITKQIETALVQIDNQLEEMKALKTPKDGEAYKLTAINTIESIKAVVEARAFFSKLTVHSAESEMIEYQKQYAAKIQAYAASYALMQQAQADFAKASGYEVK